MNKSLATVLTIFMLPFFVYGIYYGNSVGLFSETSSEDDTKSPELYISASKQGDNIIFKAVSKDNNKVDYISIFVDGSEVKKCEFNNKKEVECIYNTDNLSQGSYVYKATASDGVNIIATRDESFNL